MLCPECKCAAVGGTLCPQCGHPVPERESFGGQGSHYLRLLIATTLVLFLVFVLVADSGPGFRASVQRLYRSGWIWPFLLMFLIPIGVGIYYWFMLREDEVVVTDEDIVRTSHWGDERLAWPDVRQFRRQPMLFRQTRLGRIAVLSRYFAQRHLFLDLPAESYELLGPRDANDNPTTMLLEPGTIADMPWLVQLIEERLGPPLEDE